MSILYTLTPAQHADSRICQDIRALVALGNADQLEHRRGERGAVILVLPDGSDVVALDALVASWTAPPDPIPPVKYTIAELDALVDSITDIAGVIAHLKLLHGAPSLDKTITK